MVSVPYMLSSSVSLSLSTSSTPDSKSPSFKEGSFDSVKMKELQEPTMSAASPVVSLCVSNELGLSSTGTALEPMDIARAERIAYLEETTINKDSDLRSLTKDIKLLVDERRLLQIKTEELTGQEKRRLQVIEEEDLPDMRGIERRLVAEITNHEKELSELKNQGPIDVCFRYGTIVLPPYIINGKNKFDVFFCFLNTLTRLINRL